MNNIVLKIAAISAIIIVPLVWYAEFDRYRSITSMLAHGKQVDAKVTSHWKDEKCHRNRSLAEHSSTKRSYVSCYKIRYEFIDHEGFYHEDMAVVSKEIFRSLAVGKMVRVLYREDNPSDTGVHSSYVKAAEGNMLIKTLKAPLILLFGILALGVLIHFMGKLSRNGKP